jgi:hypothetical protein
MKFMRIRKRHLGVGFEVWNAQQSWFWCVANTNRNGMIGAAATESDAMRDAHSSIEELSNSNNRPEWEIFARKSRTRPRLGLRGDRVRS